MRRVSWPDKLPASVNKVNNSYPLNYESKPPKRAIRLGRKASSLRGFPFDRLRIPLRQGIRDWEGVRIAEGVGGQLMKAKRIVARKSKMKKTMEKFKRGTLHSGSVDGPLVRNRKQAVAIGLAKGRRNT